MSVATLAPVNRSSMQRRRAVLVLGWVVALAGFAVLQYGVGFASSWATHFLSDMAWTVASLLAAAAAFHTALSLGGRQRAAWLVFGLASFVWFLGQLYWDYQELVAGVITPFPAPSDIGYLVFPLLMSLGLLLNSVERTLTRIAFKHLCNLGLLAAALYSIIAMLLHDVIETSQESLLYIATSVAYPVLFDTACLFGLVSLVLYINRRQHGVLVLLILGLLAHAIAETLYGFDLLGRSYEAGEYVDIMWLVGFALLHWAAWERRVVAATGDDAQGETGITRQAWLLEPLVPAMALAAVMIAMLFDKDGLQPGEIGFALLPGGLAFAAFLALSEWSSRTAEAELRTRADSALHALRLSEKRLASILEIAPEAIVASDQHGRIKLFNSGAERIFNYKSNEVIGQPIDMLIPDRFRVAHSAHMRAFSNSNQPSRLMSDRRDITALRKDGTEFPAEGSVFKLDLDEGQLFAVILRDITEHRRHERELRAAKEVAELANRAKSEFLANMSHELRTPLNAILGFSEMIENRLFGTDIERSVAYAHDIHESGKLLLDLITDILDLSKIEAGHAELHEETIDLGRTIDGCLKVISDRARRGNLIVLRNLPDRLPRLWVDERKLKQMIINLLSNAVKFTASGGTVEISTRLASDGDLEILIRDNGIGMDPEQIPLALSPFGQIDQGLARRHEGTGLGLPLVSELIRLHGGTLTLHSASGKGTTAILRLPKVRVMVDAPGSNGGDNIPGQLPSSHQTD